MEGNFLYYSSDYITLAPSIGDKVRYCLEVKYFREAGHNQNLKSNSLKPHPYSLGMDLDLKQ